VTPRLLIEPARLAGRSLLRMQTDERLVDLVRAGNDRAFEAIVDRYRRPLLRYCGRLLPPTRAEDVVQQAFLNAFAALRRSDASIDLRPWLYRIAHNASLNALRENGWSDDELEAFVEAGEGPHEIAERLDHLRSVLEAVQTLPERQRDAMILRELEGYTYEQIAAELDATGGAVRQLLNRARNTLRGGVTALTPAGVLGRLGWTGQPVVERVSAAVMDDGLRVGAARLAGALVAGLALAGGMAAAPRQAEPRVGAAPAVSGASGAAAIPAPAPARVPLTVPAHARRVAPAPAVEPVLTPDVVLPARREALSKPAPPPPPAAAGGNGTPARTPPAPPQPVPNPPVEAPPAALSEDAAKAPAGDPGAQAPQPVATAAQHAAEAAPDAGPPPTPPPAG
jgi:RNA polymerase sigma factor (sigma-70 family)